MVQRIRFLILFIFIYTCLFPLHAQTLREKIGQMVWTSFSSTKLNDTIKIDLAKRNMGGITLFASSINNPNQIKLLNDSIKMFSKTSPFIAVDQEGGKIARLGKSNGFAETYSAYTLGSIFNSEDSTRRTAAKMAGWLKQSGFNINLAPVIDVNVNPSSPAIGKLERSYSSNPEIVAAHAIWFIDEFDKKGLLTCLKHFPGHGSALQDSHLGFTDITKTWSSNELIPYQRIIAQGYKGAVMTGHLFNQNLDPFYPASLSSSVSTNILRNQLGFNGLVVTDGMQMQAITNNYGFETAIELAVLAGNDVLLYTGTLRNGTSLAKQVIDIIERKVIEGKISIGRIDESYNRIIKTKMKFGIIASVDQLAKSEIPAAFTLYQNYPNPFNPETVISYQLPVASYVTLKVYDVLGNEVATLVDEYKQPGIYSSLYVLNSSFSSGVYFYSLQSGNYVETKKMTFLK